jgi:hypothetical protein
MDGNIQFITFSITIEKRLFGVIITILGITGLILATYSLVKSNTETNHSGMSMAIYSIQGIIFFFAGIGLIRNTKDLTNLRSVQDLMNLKNVKDLANLKNARDLMNIKSAKDLTKRSSINEHGKLINLQGSREEQKEKIKEFYPEIMDADLIFMGGGDDELTEKPALKLYKNETEIKNRLESIAAG